MMLIVKLKFIVYYKSSLQAYGMHNIIVNNLGLSQITKSTAVSTLRSSKRSLMILCPSASDIFFFKTISPF